MNPDVPTGNSGEVVRRYFEYLYDHYLSKLSQNTYIHWDVLLVVLIWVFGLATLFFVYTRWQRHTRQSKEPYPIESYNGYIEEANGPVGLFLTLFFISMVFVLLTITVLNLLHGQLY